MLPFLCTERQGAPFLGSAALWLPGEVGIAEDGRWVPRNARAFCPSPCFGSLPAQTALLCARAGEAFLTWHLRDLRISLFSTSKDSLIYPDNPG